MIEEKEVRPSISHGAERGEVKKYEMLIDKFATLMKSHVKRMIKGNILGPIETPTLESLLALRQSLVRAVEEGMLERKDQETQIAILSAVIWYNRLGEAKKHAIDSYWG